MKHMRTFKLSTLAGIAFALAVMPFAASAQPARHGAAQPSTPPSAAGDALVQTVSSGYNWVNFQPGQFGPHLVIAGNMPDGMPVFVCGAYHNGGFHTGMTGMWSDGCSIGFGGSEFVINQFQVLVGQARWQSYRGNIPGNAVEGGYEADGRKLYICRVTQDGWLSAGKFRPGFRGCNIGDGGSEVSLNPFDLLVF
jgi:hypothetical protein